MVRDSMQPRTLGGRYELDGNLGNGDLAEVVRARDIRLDRVVAVKMLRDDLASDQSLQARFRRRAQVAASLNHPSIVAVYDTGEDMLGPTPISYIVMEYVDGQILRDLLRDDRRLVPERAAEITEGILQALAYSHQNGIVHHNIRPDNVMLTRAHEVKVMNFGLLRITSDTQLSGPVIAAAEYLSPEQARGDGVDARSDLYSTGCLLYEMLTGRLPFTGDSPVAIAYQHVREMPVPPSQVNREVPVWADHIVLKAMAKDPASRCQSADEMLSDIKRASSVESISQSHLDSSVALAPTVVIARTHSQEPSSEESFSPQSSPEPADQRNTGPAIGSRISGYRIEALLGMGGMAQVFLAVDERLGRQVALKVMVPALSRDEAFRLRFIRESRVAAAVDHPNIIPVYEAGEADGVLFIAMRYVRNGDAKSLVTREGALPPERAMAIISPIAAALDAAHARSLVHRDVKPGNMLLDSSTDQPDHVYLTDFGLTTMQLWGASLTETGTFLGTLDYVAPEQIEGRPVDGRTDQYALACSAFELLSGSLPFARDESMAVLWAHMSVPPPPLTSRRPELPHAVDEVFAQALAKTPANRFATCGQFAEALSAALAFQWKDGPDRAGASSRALTIPLKRTFRYVHEPSRGGEDALSSLGNDPFMEELQSRILHSHGGTFLVTGFRGVGKSTLILRALDEIVTSHTSSDLILPVTLSVARSTTTERLLFAIVRRVFETLADSGAIERLPPPTQHALLLAYMRTSLSFKETQSEARERSASMDLGVGPGKAVKALADFAFPKVSMSTKRSHSLATEAAFLAYSETDVEYDLMRIVSLVGNVTDVAAERRSWLRRLWPRQTSPASPRLRLVIVLDEVDKLTTDAAGLAVVEELLSGIKNVLTTSGAHFLVVAGPDLHDRATQDATRGNGVYESVFGWRLYVPCIWDAPDRLVSDIVSANAEVDEGMLALLADYLRFKARGMPRRLLQEVNSFTTWDGDRPSLRIDAKDMERVEFYARLERILRAYFEGSQSKRLFPVAIDEDRWRLAGYYVADWVLQREGDPFTAADLIRDGDEAEFDPLLRISRRNVDRLLDHLAEHRIVDIVREMDATSTVFGDIAESSAKVFILAEDVRHLLYGFVARYESERGAREVSLAPPVPASAQAVGNVSALIRPSPRVLASRYELGDLLGQGGMNSVYKGKDLVTGRQVVIKLLRTDLGNDPQAMARFRREADIARRLTHPQIVQTYDVVNGQEQTPALIMEWLNGPNLHERIMREGPMPPAEVAATGRVLAEALAYIASQQIVRLDLKPSNIIMADRGPVIIDLGIAFRVETGTHGLTQTGQLVGTPAFMARELIAGREPDPRVDLYALGLVMFYCLTGRSPWEGIADQMGIMMAIMNEEIDVTNLPVSPEFRQVLARVLAGDRDQRFPNATDLRDAITKTPEWHLVDTGSSNRDGKNGSQPTIPSVYRHPDGC